MLGRDRASLQLRAVAPLVVADAPARLVGPVTLVAHGERVVGITDAELLRAFHGQRLAIATRLDGSTTIPIASWGLGRYTGLGIVELAAPLPATPDLSPLPIDAVCASVGNTQHAPAAIVTLAPTARGFERVVVSVHVDPEDTSGMMDRATYLASAIEAADSAITGCPVFAWFAPDPVLGRPSEVVLVALAYRYRGVARPRAAPVLAELVGLDDLGRALLSSQKPDDRPELAPAAGEIDDGA